MKSVGIEGLRFFSSFQLICLGANRYKCNTNLFMLLSFLHDFFDTNLRKQNSIWKSPASRKEKLGRHRKPQPHSWHPQHEPCQKSSWEDKGTCLRPGQYNLHPPTSPKSLWRCWAAGWPLGLPGRALVLTAGSWAHRSSTQHSELGRGWLFWKLKHSCSARLARINVKIKLCFSVSDRTFQPPHRHGGTNNLHPETGSNLQQKLQSSQKTTKYFIFKPYPQLYLRMKYSSLSDLQPENLGLQYRWKQLYFNMLSLWLHFQLRLVLVQMGSSDVIHLIKVHQMTLLDWGTDGTFCIRSEAAWQRDPWGSWLSTLATAAPVDCLGRAVQAAPSPRAQPSCCRSPAGWGCLLCAATAGGGSLREKNWERNYVCARNNSFSNANSLL